MFKRKHILLFPTTRLNQSTPSLYSLSLEPPIKGWIVSLPKDMLEIQTPNTSEYTNLISSAKNPTMIVYCLQDKI